MVSRLSPLSPKQLKAVSGVAKGLSLSQVAKTLKVSTRTVERWRKLPEFVVALDQIQGQVSENLKSEIVREVTSVASQIELLASKSLQCLEGILDNPDARNADRIQAAKILLGEWQRQQPAQIDALEAVHVLVRVGWLSPKHIDELKRALDVFQAEGRSIFNRFDVPPLSEISQSGRG